MRKIMALLLLMFQTVTPTPAGYVQVTDGLGGYTLMVYGGGSGGGGNSIGQLTGDGTAGPATASGQAVALTVGNINGGTPFKTQGTGVECNTTGTGQLSNCVNLASPGYLSAATYSEMGVYNVPCTSNTPVFDLSQGNIQILNLSSGCSAITSSSVINPPASGKGRPYLFWIVEDATGGRPFPNPGWANNWTPVNTAANSQTATLLWFTSTGNIADNSGASQCAVSGASPASCGTARSGYVTVPAGTNSTMQVNTSAFVSTAGIQLTEDTSVGAIVTPNVTCDTTEQSIPIVTARNPGTSFTITTPGTTTGPTCVFYTVVNN